MNALCVRETQRVCVCVCVCAKLKVAQEQSCLFIIKFKKEWLHRRDVQSEVEGTVQNYSLRKKQSQKEEGWSKWQFPHKKDFQLLI